MKALLLACLLAGSARAAAPAAVEAEAAAVVDLFYDLRFEEALEAARGLEARHPGHPAGAFYAGVVRYQRLLLAASSAERERARRDFEKENDRCVALAEALEERDQAASEYYLGACHGFRARALVAERRLFAALRRGAKGYRHLQRAAQLAPGWEDVYLGLGMYNYFASFAPAAAKPFTRVLIGLWGDRALGLAQLERAAEKGAAAKMEARSVLSAVYGGREARWDRSEELLAELMARYPRNPLYRLRRIHVAQRRGDFKKAAQWAEPDGAWVEDLAPPLQDASRRGARYRRAESLLYMGDAAGAWAELDGLDPAAAAGEEADWLRLRRAQALEGLGRREQAVAERRAVASADLRGRLSVKESGLAPFRWPPAGLPE